MSPLGPLRRGHLPALLPPGRLIPWILLFWLLFAAPGRAAGPAPRHPEPESKQLEIIQQRWLWTVLGGALAGTAYFLTRLYRSRDELQKQTDFLQSILDSMGEGVCLQGLDGRIIRTNPVAQQIEGRTDTETRGRDSNDPIWGAVREDGSPFPGDEHPSMVTLRTGRPQREVIMGIRRPDGERRWISINSEPLLNTAKAKPYAVVTTFRDITDWKDAEELLHAREQEFRALAENTPDAICRFDRGCRFIYSNPAHGKLMGSRRPALRGRTPLEVYPPAPSVQLFQQKVQAALDAGEPSAFEIVLDALPGDNPQCHFIRLAPERDRNGRVVSVLCVGRDISALKETERQLRTLVEHSPDIILRFDRAGCYRFVNHAMEKVTGIPAAEFIDRPVGEIAARRHGPAVAEKFRLLGQAVGRVFATGRTIEEEMRLPMPAGELIYNVRLIPETDETGQVATVLTIAREVTARQRAEEALHSSEQRFRQVTENIDEVFWLTDLAKDEMVYISPAYRHVWGRTCESLYAQPQSWLEAVHPDDRARVRSAALTLQAAGGYDLEYRIVRPDETVRWIHDRAFPIKDAEGRVFRIAGVAADITAKHQLEDQLRQTQKMESLGTLAGGIAHDFNNILTGVLGAAEVARLELPPDHPVAPWIHNITVAGNRARNLVQQILTFGRKHESELAPRKLQIVLAEALRLLRSTIPSMVQIESHIDEACPPVIADDTQIHQVVMNLCTNAWHALPEHGGRIEIGLAPVQVTSAMAAARLGLAAGPHVRLTVRDNGHGMAPGVLARIFEPFFTTKQQGQGTGLGLAVVHGIVQSHHGAIFVQSTPGQGTLFEIFLPAPVVGLEGGLPPSAEEPLARGHGEQILLVDDDPTALAGLRAQLEYLGYKVTALSGSRVALKHFLAAPAEVDLIMTDYAMPDYTGHELIAKVLATRPRFPVILTSGFMDPGQIEKMRTLGIRDFVRKPIPLPDLARMLARHLRPVPPR